MGYEYNTATAIAAAQNQASVTVNNHLSNSCTVSTAGHRTTCRSTPYTLRHKYIQDGEFSKTPLITSLIITLYQILHINHVILNNRLQNNAQIRTVQYNCYIPQHT